MNKISRRNFVPLLGSALIGVTSISLQQSNNSLIPTLDVILPKKLKRGNTVGICAPAGGIKNQSEISEFVTVLESFGFKVKVGKSVPKQFGYFSDSDENRANEFMDFIVDPSIDAIFFIRGGWGCARILNYLDFEVIKGNPKVILGFSDITALLNAISKNTGLVTFHGPGGNSTWNDYTRKYIEQLCFKGDNVLYENAAEDDSVILTYSSGKAIGKLYGGNLSVISSLIGSGYLPEWKDKILFLEDIGEEPYRIDRMLTQLKLANVFSDVNGVILGNFRKCIAEEPERSFTIEEVFEQHFSGLSIPVYYGAQIGHAVNKFTVPIGITAEMNADNGTFKLMSPAVL